MTKSGFPNKLVADSILDAIDKEEDQIMYQLAHGAILIGDQ